jgi:hypothetical protein
MWELLTGEEPYADMHCGAIIGKNMCLKRKLKYCTRQEKIETLLYDSIFLSLYLTLGS